MTQLSAAFERHLQSCCVTVAAKSRSGTAFFFSPGMLLTSAHVVSGAESISVLWRTRLFNCQVVHQIDPDLAILQIINSPIENLVTSCVHLDPAAAVGDLCYSFGYAPRSLLSPLAEPDATTLVIEGLLDGYEIKLKSGQVLPGRSGSPLLNLRTGSVCGVIRTTRSQDSDLGGRAVSIASLFDQLPRLARTHRAFHVSDGHWAKLSARQAVSSADRSARHIPIPPAPYIAHPYPMHENFTGRQTELKLLTNWLRDDGAPPIYVLTAMGGMGKSALAWAWLNSDVLEESDVDGVLWWSFYETEAQFKSFVIDALLYSGHAQSSDLRTGHARVQALARILEHGRFLVVLDGYERELAAYSTLGASYQSDDIGAPEAVHVRQSVDPDAPTLLRSVAARSHSKLLITSRLLPLDLEGPDGKPLAGCQHRDLKGLESADALAFFRAQGVHGTDAQIRDVAKSYDYHSLSLRLLTGLIVHDFGAPGDIAVARQPIPSELLRNRKHHVLQMAFDALTPAQQQLLSRIAAFRATITFDAIRVCGVFDSDADLRKAVDAILQRGLLSFDRTRKRFDLHPVVRHYCYDRLLDKQGVHTRLREYYYHVPTNEISSDSLETLHPLIELYHHTVAGGHEDEAYRLLRDRLTETVYYRLGATRLFLQMVEALWFTAVQTELRPREIPTWEETDRAGFYAWMLNALGLAYSRSGQPTKALECFEALAERDQALPWEYHATTLTSLGYELLNCGRLRDGHAVLSRAATPPARAVEGPRDELGALCASIELARAEAIIGRTRDGVRRLTDVIGGLNVLAPKLVSRGSNASFDPVRYVGQANVYLAEIHMRRGDSKALSYAQTAAETATRTAHQLDLCAAETVLGKAESIFGDLAVAEGLLSSALVRARENGIVDLEIGALLALMGSRITASQRSGDAALLRSAEQLGADASALIASGGYRLHEGDLLVLQLRVAERRGDVGRGRQIAQAAREIAAADGRGFVNTWVLECIDRPI